VDGPAPEFVAPFDDGRRFRDSRPVRLGDVSASGRVRLDAIARYLQDVATDDAADAGLADGWVLRRLALWIDDFPRLGTSVDLVTWCSGVSGSAAERRTTISVEGERAVEAVALWVFVGPDGRPARLDRRRFARYGASALERRVSTRLRHRDPNGALVTRPWPLRACDVDVLGHVNNAVALAALEDLLRGAGTADAPVPWWIEVEFRAPIEPDDTPVLAWVREQPGVIAAWLRCDGDVRTTARLEVSEPSTDRTYTLGL
jgi:acyl-ACP thioesterase